jgi:uncharacterized repeat protein (TIGR01451 family)
VSLAGNNFAGLSVIITSDGGYFFAGAASSNDGDLTTHQGTIVWTNPDYWAVKLDTAGILEWQISLGGSAADKPYSTLQTADGGYILAGVSSSLDGDFTGGHGSADAWIVKLDSAGTVDWKKNYGGSAIDFITSIKSTSDGGYFAVGSASSQNNGDVAGSHGSRDAWVLKLDVNCNLQWQKCLGGSAMEIGTGGFQTADGGYMVVSWTGSNNFDVSGNHSLIYPAYDNWLVKLSAIPANTISGTIYEDLNANCIKDSGEIALAGRIVKAMPGNYYGITDAIGNYTLFVDSGSYVVSHVPNAYYNQSCPLAGSGYAVTLTTAIPNAYGNNFADTVTSHCSELTLSMGTPLLRRCFKNTYVVSFHNKGALSVANASITVDFDPEIIPLTSTLPWTVTGTQYTFSVGTLVPGQSGIIYITDSVSCSSINGTVKCITATITIDSTECDTVNNIVHDCHTIVGSCDPNNKEVAIEDSTIAFDSSNVISATDALSYQIHFQNTGTDTAFTVIVRDTLSSYLDPLTVVPGAASYPYTFRIYGQGILEWTFNNILLPDSNTNEVASHGFLKFTIEQISGNAEGTAINNMAGIWFDYNQAVNTNQAESYIPLALSAVTTKTEVSTIVLVYPNPTRNSFLIKSEISIGTFSIYNSIGEMIQNGKTSAMQHMVDLSEKAAGIYFLKIGNEHIKIIKQ